MRVVPYGLGWSSSCVLDGWEMICPCDRGRLFSLCLGLFLADKGEAFGFVRDLILRLKNERHGDVVRAICRDNGSEFKNSRFETFCRDLGLEHQFSSPYVAY
jgi:transposase InsO family protein